ncbi:hypothetical protein NC652_018238 [Populus alba x Populus x berolinensis]|nr:hypothetical protein NC652_018238 [Populus alba x Populus x berolinensis]
MDMGNKRMAVFGRVQTIQTPEMNYMDLHQRSVVLPTGGKYKMKALGHMIDQAGSRGCPVLPIIVDMEQVIPIRQTCAIPSGTMWLLCPADFNLITDVDFQAISEPACQKEQA